MKIEPLGDAAYVLRELDRPAFEVAAALNAVPPSGLIEAVAGYETVGLFIDPERFQPDALAAHLRDASPPTAPRHHTIPVCYELGLDLEEAAERLSITRDELIAAHSGIAYQCYAVGFCPGFPYLGYLDAAIAGLPRRPSPRVRVPPGSVAITGRQTGVYTMERPGGWWLLGRTPLCLVDVEADYFPIAAGDQITFVRVDREEYERREGERL